MPHKNPTLLYHAVSTPSSAPSPLVLLHCPSLPPSVSLLFSPSRSCLYRMAYGYGGVVCVAPVPKLFQFRKYIYQWLSFCIHPTTFMVQTTSSGNKASHRDFGFGLQAVSTDATHARRFSSMRGDVSTSLLRRKCEKRVVAVREEDLPKHQNMEMTRTHRGHLLCCGLVWSQREAWSHGRSSSSVQRAQQVSEGSSLRRELFKSENLQFRRI